MEKNINISALSYIGLYLQGQSQTTTQKYKFQYKINFALCNSNSRKLHVAYINLHL